MNWIAGLIKRRLDSTEPPMRDVDNLSGTTADEVARRREQKAQGKR